MALAAALLLFSPSCSFSLSLVSLMIVFDVGQDSQLLAVGRRAGVGVERPELANRPRIISTKYEMKDIHPLQNTRQLIRSLMSQLI